MLWFGVEDNHSTSDECCFYRSEAQIVGAYGDEGTPVPIPNTVVKLVNGDNTWLATAREDNSVPTQTSSSGSIHIQGIGYVDIPQ